MTILCWLLAMGEGVPAIFFPIAMLCDTAIIITLALTGVIHR